MQAPAGTFTGKIVVCKRGNPEGRVADGYNVKQGGAVGMILYNASAASTDLETDNHFLPVSHIQFADGQALVAFWAAHARCRWRDDRTPGSPARLGATSWRRSARIGPSL